ncbi:MAG TPA: ABC transporter permease [Verrucomicrobiae bacterium]|nr:ABC transporter permease [Verrucomicrobiae bacterium]
MLRYILRRLGWAVAVLLSVGTVTFVLVYVLPADPARVIAGPRASADAVARISHQLGLDQPLLAQLGAYAGRALHGDLGHSFSQNMDVVPLILQRFPATLQLALAGLFIELIIGVPLGLLAATRRDSIFDRGSTVLSIILVSAPSFWVGLLLIHYLGFLPHTLFGIDLFPIGGYKPLDLRYLILPALTVGFAGAAYYTRLTRVTMLEELHRDYVRTARAKGLPESTVNWRHAFRNAVGPILTQVGLDIGFFLGGVVVVEQIFSWPGIGKLAVDSIRTADVPLIMGTVLFATLCIVLANLTVDVLAAVFDPRIRL